jgi:hypothetical protein
VTTPGTLRFNPSLRSFPTFRGLARALLAVVTLGRSGMTDQARAAVDRASLPEPLRSLVLETARATRLWANERADVARELASHFRAGLDDGHPAEALAANFGDVATSAALIRRAAHRKRPLAWRVWRWFWKGVGVLLLVGIVMYAIFAARYFAGSPTIARNYYNEHNESVRATPANDRAWLEYRRALMAMPNWPSQAVQDNWPVTRVDDPLYVVAKSYIDSAQPQLDIVRAAALRPRLGAEWGQSPDGEFDVRMAQRRGIAEKDIDTLRESFRLSEQQVVDNPDLIGVLLPHLGQMRALARDLMFDATVARNEGDADRLAADIHAMLGLAHQAGNDTTLISQLVGYAVLHVGTNEVLRTLTHEPGLLSNDQLATIAHRMNAAIKPGTLEPDLAGERLFMDDLLQRAYTDDGAGDGRMTPNGVRMLAMYASAADNPYDGGIGRPYGVAENLVGPVYVQVMAGRKDLKREYDRLLAAVIANSRRPVWERLGQSQPSEIERLSHDTAWTARFLPIKVLMPALEKAHWAGQRISTERDAAAAAIACELHRRATGAWPAALADIPTSLLPRVPLDPFTGKPLLYRVENGTPRIYSTGNDQDDDAGTVSDQNALSVGSDQVVLDGDWVLWPLKE